MGSSGRVSPLLLSKPEMTRCCPKRKISNCLEISGKLEKRREMDGWGLNDGGGFGGSQEMGLVRYSKSLLPGSRSPEILYTGPHYTRIGISRINNL